MRRCLTIISYCSLAFIFKLAFAPYCVDYPRQSFAFFLDIIARWQMRQALHRHRSKGSCKYRTVVIGSSDGINKALQTMRNCMNWGCEPVAVCPIEADPASKDAYVVTSYTPDANIEGSSKLKVIPFNSAFPRICESLGVQEVYVADVLSRDSENVAWSFSCGGVAGYGTCLGGLPGGCERSPFVSAKHHGTASSVGFPAAVHGSCERNQAFAGHHWLTVRADYFLSDSSRVAIAIKLDDGGPVFFSQTRIGLHGKPFKMYKFRSMVTNAEELKKKLAEETGQEDRFIFKMKDDPRITKVGHFIRKTSLDEFPQFYNVLKGDMSLVGPRPALPEEVARYGSLYSARLLVKPGITGPWQVSGRSDLSQEQSEYLDVSYIENWSIAGDLAILAKTVMVIFTGRGSY